MDYTHTITIPKSAIYYHGTSPVIQDLSKQEKKPTSELMSEFVQAKNEVDKKINEDPNIIVPGEDGKKMRNQMVWDTALNLILTGNTGDDDDMISDALTNPDGQSAMANMFSADDGTPAAETSINDPMSMGFSDSGMNAISDAAGGVDDQILGAPDDFQTDTYINDNTDNNSAGSVNSTDEGATGEVPAEGMPITGGTTAAEAGSPNKENELSEDTDLGSAYTQV